MSLVFSSKILTNLSIPNSIIKTGSLGPFKFISTIQDSEVVRFISSKFHYEDDSVSLWYQEPTSGEEIMRPGLKFKVDKGSTPLSKLNFVSLMIALFFGTVQHIEPFESFVKMNKSFNEYWTDEFRKDRMEEMMKMRRET